MLGDDEQINNLDASELKVGSDPWRVVTFRRIKQRHLNNDGVFLNSIVHV